MTSRHLAAILGAALCLAAGAEPSERLPNPAQEARARGLFREVRCLVCQGESIDDSDAPFAGDLRRVIRVQVARGETDDQIRGFLTARYSDFVLFRPRLTPMNALLWGGPFAVALLGLGVLAARARPAPTPPPLTAEEEAQIRDLAADDPA
jgi:cytochrome c-type biogenesis protein CcmH